MAVPPCRNAAIYQLSQVTLVRKLDLAFYIVASCVRTPDQGIQAFRAYFV